MDGSSIPEAYARRVYNILVEECGAPTDPESFVYHQSQGCIEWRFQGNLGFGGKFWNANGKWYVSYYPEDRNKKRDSMVEKANQRLSKLHEECVSP